MTETMRLVMEMDEEEKRQKAKAKRREEDEQDARPYRSTLKSAQPYLSKYFGKQNLGGETTKSYPAVSSHRDHPEEASDQRRGSYGRSANSSEIRRNPATVTGCPDSGYQSPVHGVHDGNNSTGYNGSKTADELDRRYGAGSPNRGDEQTGYRDPHRPPPLNLQAPTSPSRVDIKREVFDNHSPNKQSKTFKMLQSFLDEEDN